MEGDAIVAQELAAKEVASMLGITPKAFRRFVRTQAKTDAAIIGACGQGNRYGITQAEARRLVSAYRKAHATSVPVDREQAAAEALSESLQP